MAYSIFDSRGHVAEVASIGGWADFRKAAEAKSPGPETRSLVAAGASDDPDALAEELRKAIFADPSADSVRKELLRAAQKSKDTAIITDGVGHEPRKRRPRKS